MGPRWSGPRARTTPTWPWSPIRIAIPSCLPPWRLVPPSRTSCGDRSHWRPSLTPRPTTRPSPARCPMCSAPVTSRRGRPRPSRHRHLRSRSRPTWTSDWSASNSSATARTPIRQRRSIGAATPRRGAGPSPRAFDSSRASRSPTTTSLTRPRRRPWDETCTVPPWPSSSTSIHAVQPRLLTSRPRGARRWRVIR